MRTRLAGALIVLVVAASASAQSIALGRDFYRHGLADRAKEELILVLHGETRTDAEKSEALDWLGQIAFDEGRYGVAIDTWENLLSTYPDTVAATGLQDRLDLLREVVSETTTETIDSAVASSYIRNGDFWNGSDERFTIDSSWLTKLDLAIEWYQLVIDEFPGTTAAETAYRKMLFAILGWRDPGQYGSSWGIEANPRTGLPRLVDTFRSFERDFPQSSFLQGFRYQIAQVYWGMEDWDNTRAWLTEIIEHGGEQESFYTSTARARLQKVEY